MHMPKPPILRGRLVGFSGSRKLSNAAGATPAATSAIATGRTMSTARGVSRVRSRAGGRGGRAPVKSVSAGGERPRDIAAFRLAEEDEATRAAMACALLRTQDDYVGMSRLEIRPLFGDPDGYYYTELQPAYLIETARSMAEDSWQIVFLIDGDRNVRKIVVHKNCC